MITFLYEQTLKYSTIDEKLDEKSTGIKKVLQSLPWQKSCFLEKHAIRSRRRFWGHLAKESTSPEQITKLIDFLSQTDVNISFSKNIKFFKPRNKISSGFQSNAPTECSYS